MLVININREQKLFKIQVSGFIRPGEASEFLRLYKDSTYNLQLNLYTLVIDLTGFSIISPVMVSLFEKSLKKYIYRSYAQVYVIKSKSLLCNMQIRQIFDKSAISVIYVDSANDIYLPPAS